MVERLTATVVGGGIAGIAAAVSLARAGWPVTVLERAPGFGQVGAYLLDGTLPAADVTCHRTQPTAAARRSLMRPYLMRP